jgi:hypothetical protein
MTGSDRILGASLYRQALNHLKSGLSQILGPDLVQSNPARSPNYTPRFLSLHVFARQYLDHGRQPEGKRGKRHLGIHYFREAGVFKNDSWRYVYSTALTLGYFMSVGVALAVSVKVTATIKSRA